MSIADFILDNVLFNITGFIHELSEAGLTWDTPILSEILSLGMPDELWEDAAVDAGFSSHDGYDSWEDLCRSNNIEPYYREVLEIWIVTPWLADALAAEGEKIMKGFYGQALWGRTTSGRAISSDGVVKRAYTKLTQ